MSQGLLGDMRVGFYKCRGGPAASQVCPPAPHGPLGRGSPSSFHHRRPTLSNTPPDLFWLPLSPAVGPELRPVSRGDPRDSPADGPTPGDGSSLHPRRPQHFPPQAQRGAGESPEQLPALTPGAGSPGPQPQAPAPGPLRRKPLRRKRWARRTGGRASATAAGPHTGRRPRPESWLETPSIYLPPLPGRPDRGQRRRRGVRRLLQLAPAVLGRRPCCAPQKRWRTVGARAAGEETQIGWSQVGTRGGQRTRRPRS